MKTLVLVSVVVGLIYFCRQSAEGCHIEIPDCEEEYDYYYEYLSGDGDTNEEKQEEIEKTKVDCIEGGGSRHRRSAEGVDEFMTVCMEGEMPSSKPFMPYLVDFIMHHTIWYERTEKYYCEQDTVECWRSLCGYFLTWKSDYMHPTKRCIENYGKSKGRDFSPDHDQMPAIPKMERRSDYIKVEQFLNDLNGTIPDTYTEMDWKNLISFYKNDFICSADFCNCTGLPMKGDEKCGETWLSRLVGSTKPNSPFRKPLLVAADAAMKRNEQKITVVKLFYFLLQRRNGMNSGD